MSNADQPGQPERPALRIVRGEPDDEELAALTALLTARTDDASEPAEALRGGWRDPARTFRRTLLPGPNAWRSSGW